MTNDALFNAECRRLGAPAVLNPSYLALLCALLWLPLLAGAVELLPADYANVFPELNGYSKIGNCEMGLMPSLSPIKDQLASPTACLLSTITEKEDGSCGSAIRLFSYAKKDIASYAIERVKSPELRDRVNAGVYTEAPLKRLVGKVADGSTLIVQRGSLLDPSVVLGVAGEKSFVVAQHSDPKIFGQNLNRVQEFERRGELSFFDFSPRSDESAREMNGFRTNVRDWRLSSRKIADALSAVQSERVVVGERTLSSLLDRLKNPGGAVVVIYGHSDGEQIWLDTQEGVLALTPDLLRRELGAQGRLPLLALLNCETAPILVPTFLELGSPLVFGSEQQLRLKDIVAFVHEAGAGMNRTSSPLQSLYGAAVRMDGFGLYPIADMDNVATPFYTSLAQQCSCSQAIPRVGYNRGHEGY